MHDCSRIGAIAEDVDVCKVRCEVPKLLLARTLSNDDKSDALIVSDCPFCGFEEDVVGLFRSEICHDANDEVAGIDS